eukprot:TRINITY_DN23607_c0_g3_i2.p1 TRINITY_DN23607_c0_g3~~TRINITY_DN23607_c0_g3_i2.p1  ORF type:complete len:571 (+),score=148.13 TRINITY_DN23607_c0_g3_i2:309-2021(+)
MLGSGESNADGNEEDAANANSLQAKIATCLDDRRLAELSGTVMGGLNRLIAQMNHSVQTERARHNADVSMRMRKVSRDLQATFTSIQKTFTMLTRRLSTLSEEVDESRQSVVSFKEQYKQMKDAAEAQFQYVKELETVLDGQGDGFSKALKKLNASEVASRQQMENLRSKMRQREVALMEEVATLKKQVQELQEASKGGESASTTAGGVVPPPPLPEASCTWTLQTPRISCEGDPGSSGTSRLPPTWSGMNGSRACSAPCASPPGSSSGPRPGTGSFTANRPFTSDASPRRPQGPDVVSGVLAHCDATRNASRAKAARVPVLPPGGASRQAADAIKVEALKRENAELRSRLHDTEDREERTRRLFEFTNGSQQLLQQIFEELRRSRHIPAAEDDGSGGPPEDAAQVVGRLVKLFLTSLPKLGSFPELLEALYVEKVSRQATAKEAEAGAAAAPATAAGNGEQEEGLGDEDEEEEEISGFGRKLLARDSLLSMARPAPVMTSKLLDPLDFPRGGPGRRKSSIGSIDDDFSEMFGSSAHGSLDPRSVRRFSARRSSFASCAAEFDETEETED